MFEEDGLLKTSDYKDAAMVIAEHWCEENLPGVSTETEPLWKKRKMDEGTIVCIIVCMQCMVVDGRKFNVILLIQISF